MRQIDVPQHDEGIELPFVVYERDGSVKNLTGYTIYLIVWTLGTPGTKHVDGLCTIVAAGSGTCKYTTMAGDFDMDPLRYMGELELIKAGFRGSTLSFIVRVTESPTH